jgi:hypothetical protein
MPSAYYRALATCALVKQELEKEKLARQAMVMCFQKIYTSLEMYKGHLINRIRFHMDRHHTEYARYAFRLSIHTSNNQSLLSRKVRALNYKRENKRRRELKAQPSTRQSERTSPHSKEIEELKAIIAQKDEQIETLCNLLDARN